MKMIDSATLNLMAPETESQDVEYHILQPENTKPEQEISVREAAVYDSFEDLTLIPVFNFQLTLICRCEPIQPLQPTTTTVTGVATQYVTVGTVSYCYKIQLYYKLLAFGAVFVQNV